MNTRTTSSDVAPPQCLPTLRADEVESAEIVPLAQWMLFAIGTIDWEEFRGNDRAAILATDEPMATEAN